MKLLEQKKALITGATRGIGEGIARKFAAEGADVAFTYLSSAEKAQALEADLQKESVKAKGYRSDASSFEQSVDLVNQVVEDFGTIDILVNNAGITRDNLMLRMSEEDWDKVINANLKSVFNLTKQVIRPMLKQRSGSIINLSSIVGIGGNAGQANYAASKAGIIAFTKSIAKELGSRNIRSNAIAPGFIATDRTDAIDDKMKEEFFKNIPLNRFGTTEEVADLAAFLASDRASYISGQVISVCGAMNC